MKCNNKFCIWNAFDQCCPEDVETYNRATPNRLDCPVSLRSDFQEQMWNLHYEIFELSRKRNFKEMIQIKKFIESQREGE